MAVNPALVAVQGGFVPAPYQGEFIYAARDQMEVKIDGPGLRTRNKKFSSKGTVFMSNLRLVFVADKPDDPSGIHSIELPLMFITCEAFSQPIFGCNNVSGKCKMVDGSGDISWKLSFTYGGFGQMVPLFYASLEYVRCSQRHQQQQSSEESAPQPDPVKLQQTPPSYAQNQAMVDPSDPTKIYLTQTIGNDGRLPSAPPYPVV